MTRREALKNGYVWRSKKEQHRFDIDQAALRQKAMRHVSHMKVSEPTDAELAELSRVLVCRCSRG